MAGSMEKYTDDDKDDKGVGIDDTWLADGGFPYEPKPKQENPVRQDLLNQPIHSHSLDPDVASGPDTPEAGSASQ